MFEISRIKLKPAVSIVLMSLALAGCGGDASTYSGGPRGIFTSTIDCADNANFDFKTCQTAVKAAIKAHNDSSPTYNSKRVCQATERTCERTLNNKFRPRLIGFYVEAVEDEKAEPVGKPLYAAVRGEKGFRDASNTIYLETDLSIEFSRNAVAAYQAHSGGNPGGAFGT
ncbi:MAG: DUF1190 domain-containing protein [Filomicrobium sp.]